MGKLGRSIVSECMKMKRSWILWLHLLMPVVGIILFLWYYSISMWNEWSKVAGYIEVVSVLCPTMVGIVCALAADQEKQAGNMQNLLGVVNSRARNISGKLMVLLVGNFLAVLLAVVGFGVGFQVLISTSGPLISSYMVITFLIGLSQVFSYLFHLFLGLRFSKGITVGVGIVESLVAALLMTGLGTGRWQWIPCGWAGHFSGRYMQLVSKDIEMSSFSAEYKLAILCLLVFTVVALVLFYYCIGRYEGAQVED